MGIRFDLVDPRDPAEAKAVEGQLAHLVTSASSNDSGRLTQAADQIEKLLKYDAHKLGDPVPPENDEHFRQFTYDGLTVFFYAYQPFGPRRNGTAEIVGWKACD